jgi:hypothetical protein
MTSRGPSSCAIGPVDHAAPVRERYGYTRPRASLVVEPTQLVSFVMSQRMMRGIKSRAEQAVS